MPRNGNILLVANWESDVGYAWWLMETFWVAISRHFEPTGKKSYLIYPRITRIPDSITASDIKVLEHDFQAHSVTNLARLLQVIKKNGIEYIYLTDASSYSLYYLLLRLWGIKAIVVHDHTPGERTAAYGWKKLFKRSIQRIPFYTANHFVAVTEFVYKRFTEVTCIPQEKCSIARNGIVPINLDKVDPGYARREFGIPDDRTIIVTTGRASYYKGIDIFIECANRMINEEKMEQLHFLYCGDGTDIDDFKSLVERYSLEGHFTFAGKRSDIPAILASCQIGFHAATGEVGYSLSILEYMSAGLVTIVPDRPSTSLATTHMDNGILYRPRDIKSATKAIHTALNPETAGPIRDNAIRTVRENFNIESTTKQLVQILHSVYH